MSLWLKGAIEERGCGGYGCHDCPYQIDEDEDAFACVGNKRWRGYAVAISLWSLLGKPRRVKRLGELIQEMEKDENGVFVMNLHSVWESISLIAGLRQKLLEFTGNKHFRFNPDEIDWDMERYSRLITHWKNPDGTEVYTLVNALYDAEGTEYYLRGALRVGKPVLFDSMD